MAPMVHWPEVMVTYEVSEKILFSAMPLELLGRWTAEFLRMKWILTEIAG